MPGRRPARKQPQRGGIAAGNDGASAANAATTTVGTSLKSLAMRRGVDMGGHPDWRWFASIEKCPKSSCGSVNQGIKTPSLAATTRLRL